MQTGVIDHADAKRRSSVSSTQIGIGTGVQQHRRKHRRVAPARAHERRFSIVLPQERCEKAIGHAAPAQLPLKPTRARFASICGWRSSRRTSGTRPRATASASGVCVERERWLASAPAASSRRATRTPPSASCEAASSAPPNSAADISACRCATQTRAGQIRSLHRKKKKNLIAQKSKRRQKRTRQARTALTAPRLTARCS